MPINPNLVPAVPVPFRSDGALDGARLEPLYESLRAADVDGVFVSGTTGEFPTLDDAERDVVLSAALAVFGPDRVYAHVGAASAPPGRTAHGTRGDARSAEPRRDHPVLPPGRAAVARGVLPADRRARPATTRACSSTSTPPARRPRSLPSSSPSSRRSRRSSASRSVGNRPSGCWSTCGPRPPGSRSTPATTSSSGTSPGRAAPAPSRGSPVRSRDPSSPCATPCTAGTTAAAAAAQAGRAAGGRRRGRERRPDQDGAGRARPAGRAAPRRARPADARTARQGSPRPSR